MEVIVDGKVKLSKLAQSANITFPIVVIVLKTIVTV